MAFTETYTTTHNYGVAIVDIDTGEVLDLYGCSNYYYEIERGSTPIYTLGSPTTNDFIPGREGIKLTADLYRLEEGR